MVNNMMELVSVPGGNTMLMWSIVVANVVVKVGCGGQCRAGEHISPFAHPTHPAPFPSHPMHHCTPYRVLGAMCVNKQPSDRYINKFVSVLQFKLIITYKILIACNFTVHSLFLPCYILYAHMESHQVCRGV